MIHFMYQFALNYAIKRNNIRQTENFSFLVSMTTLQPLIGSFSGRVIYECAPWFAMISSKYL